MDQMWLQNVEHRLRWIWLCYCEKQKSVTKTSTVIFVMIEGTSSCYICSCKWKLKYYVIICTLICICKFLKTSADGSAWVPKQLLWSVFNNCVCLIWIKKGDWVLSPLCATIYIMCVSCSALQVVLASLDKHLPYDVVYQILFYVF